MTQKSRKIRAIAAGGAVLGLGAAITLAAWSDSEFAFGEFATGSFQIESSLDGTSWENTSEDDRLALTFAGGDSLIPGEIVATPYYIRNTETSAADATVTYNEENIAASIEGALSTRIVEVADGGACTADLTGTGMTAGTGTFPLNVGDQQVLCMLVEFDEGHTGNVELTGEIEWVFLAEQVEA